MPDDLRAGTAPLELWQPGSKRITDARENNFWSEYGYHHSETVLRNRPVVFAIEGTNYCNIKCVMCPRGEPDIMTRELGHMSTELLERIVNQADFFTEPAWLHWFGEPLMNPNIWEHIAIAKRKVTNLGLSTNATLLTSENSDRLLRSGIDTVMVAIDGASKSVYENVRKSLRFSFEDVQANVEQFLSKKRARQQKTPLVYLSMIEMQETQPEFQDFYEYWRAMGADEVMLKPYGNWAGQDEEFNKLATLTDQTGFRTPRAHPCKTLWQSLVIAWDGRVVPCCYDYDAKEVLGDLRFQTLDEIWNGPAYVSLRRRELAGRNNSPLCAYCTQAPGHQRDRNWGN
jgi:radical SAM protein with 4Fe4S-binding SPASM domain